MADYMVYNALLIVIMLALNNAYYNEGYVLLVIGGFFTIMMVIKCFFALIHFIYFYLVENNMSLYRFNQEAEQRIKLSRIVENELNQFIQTEMVGLIEGDTSLL